MRTTLTIDDDVFLAAKELAAVEGKNVGEVVSALVRKALGAEKNEKTRNGIPLLSVRPNSPRVTSELVRSLQEELL